MLSEAKHLARPGALMAGFVLAFATGISCDRESEPGESPTSVSHASPIANVDAFDPYSYYELWDGDVSLPEAELPALSREEWDAAVQAALETGIRAMNPESQRLIRQGALKAFMRSVSNVSKKIEVDGAGSAEVFEEYRLGEDGLYFGVAAREERSEGVETFWPDIPFAGDMAGPQQSRYFESESGSEHWTLVGQNWTCSSSTIFGDDNIDVAGFVWFTNVFSTFLNGDVVREEQFNGRSAVVVEEGVGESVRRIWLDEKTLLPIGFDWPPYSDPLRSRVTITGFNLARTIERPVGACPSIRVDGGAAHD